MGGKSLTVNVKHGQVKLSEKKRLCIFLTNDDALALELASGRGILKIDLGILEFSKPLLLYCSLASPRDSNGTATRICCQPRHSPGSMH